MRTGGLLATVAALGLLACHTSSESDPGRSPSAGAVPTAINPIPVAPAPTPGPSATPLPNPSSDPTIPPNIPNSTSPVTRADAKVDGLFCNNQPLPVSTSAPVGCVLRLDVTPKDASGQDTQAKTNPVWTWSNTSFWVGHGGSAYNPTMFGLAPGITNVYCTVDGIRSNSFDVSFY